MSASSGAVVTLVVHEEDGAGGSRTTAEVVPLAAEAVVPGEGALLTSEPLPVRGAVFVEIPDGVLDSDFHNAPREQLIVVLGGRLRSETTDGATTELGVGDVILVRDVAGRGHRATVVEAPLRVLFLPLA